MNMNFSLTNIESLINSNQLEISELLAQFERADLIGTARNIDSAGLPWGSWKKVVVILDQFLSDNGWQFQRSQNVIFNVNVAYFAPNIFVKHNDMFDMINELSSIQQLNYILVNEIILNKLANLIKNSIYEMLLKMNLLFFTTLLMALSTGEYISEECEIDMCENMLKIHCNENNIFIQVIKHRLKVLKSKNNTNTVKSTTQINQCKVALLISGQLRGFEEAVPKFIHKFNHMNHIDAYISTWSNIGYTRLNFANLYRIFDEQAREYILANKDNIDFDKLSFKLSIFASNIYSVDNIKTKLHNMLSWCENVHINIKNDTEYPYNKMTNSEKMYYHNSYWVETMGYEYFNQYDYIIKIRPDYHFKDATAININDIEQNYILADTSKYIIQEWGFGLGDQLWIGKTTDMLSLLNCHQTTTLSYKYMRTLYESNPYKGHINCGIQAWLSGIKIIQHNEKLQKNRLSGLKQLSLDQLLEILQ